MPVPRFLAALAVPAALVTASGCKDSIIVVGGLQEVAAMKAIPNRDLDILFVVDDSASTSDKQSALAAAFPRMIDVLQTLDGGLPNLHIGVISSDMGTSASEDAAPGPAIGQIGNGGCSGRGDDGRLQTSGAPVSGDFISDIQAADGTTRLRNYNGELRDVFGQAARIGANGCGFEQHLSAMQHALGSPLNVGFMREKANLAVVILADEDDCSARHTTLFGPENQSIGVLQSFRCFRFGVTCDQDTNTVGPKTDCGPATGSAYLDDVKPYADGLIALKGDQRKIMVAGILGDPAPVAVELRVPPGGGTPQQSLAHSCSANTATGPYVADPGVRLAAFLDQFPGRSTLTSICSDDFSNPLGLIGESAKRLIGDPCLDTTLLADAELELEGVQPSCEVVDIRDSAPTDAVSLAACASGAGDCFELVADVTACPSTSDHLRVRVNRASTVSDDTWTHVRCQLAD